MRRRNSKPSSPSDMRKPGGGSPFAGRILTLQRWTHDIHDFPAR